MKKLKKRFRTNILFSVPNYLVGAGSILNLAGNYFEFDTSESGEQADYKALLSDWGMTGHDMHDALDKYEKSDYAINE